MSDVSRGPGWWQASDGRWYAPELHPSYRPPPPHWQLPAPQGPGYPCPPTAGFQWQPRRATNGFAIASLVLGIVWIYWIGSILALIFGYIARRQITQRGEQGDGMAIAGIVLGWVGVATGIALLILAIVVANTHGSN